METIRHEWITTAVRGHTFAEVGGLWGTVNEQVTVAAAGGATELTMIDVVPDGDDPENLWNLFRQRLDDHDVSGVRMVRGSIDDPETVRRAGSFDVVSCSGVLYHCPEPLHTLRRLRSLTRKTLVLGTATMPEMVSTAAGTVEVPPGSALFVPAMTYSQRAVMGEWLRENGAPHAHGINHNLDTAFATKREEWRPYEGWWWFFTRDYVAALLDVAGFDVRNIASYWNGRATFFLAMARPQRETMLA